MMGNRQKNKETSMPDYGRLPDERRSITHRFEINGNKGIIIVSMYDDGKPGEIFLKMHKAGSTVRGLLNALAKNVSKSLKKGVPLKELIKLQAGDQFEPSGMTNNPCIQITKSITDYVFVWLGIQFLSLEDLREVDVITKCDTCGKAVKCGRKTYACTAVALKLIA
jgi:ribonucleoside-diphosphate reductase alpha chain